MNNSKITTVAQLREALSRSPGQSGYSAVVDRVDIPLEALEPYLHWKKEDHSRVSLYDSEAIEAVLTCWEPGQGSAIHNYDFKQGWVVVIQGELYLELYHIHNKKVSEVSELSLHDRDVFYLNDGMGFHRFSNSSPRRTIALFLYAGKVDKWSVYDEDSGVFKTEIPNYDNAHS